jgi:succinoglycan biosynthesis protein ExoA
MKVRTHLVLGQATTPRPGLDRPGWTPQLPLVSIIMPVRNEVAWIEACLQSVLTQEDPGGAFEVLIADGMSTDGTRALLAALAARDARVRLLDNPQQTVSHGLNGAIRAARGRVIVRMDAHTHYAPDYVRQCVSVLRETGAGAVGGAWRAVGYTPLQQAIALAFQSPFACGGARSHAVQYEGAVDAVYLGCWLKTTLEQIGGFDEALIRNQDDELSLRLRLAGFTLWQSRRIHSWYVPRASLRALFRQYAQYGYWKVRVMRTHRRAQLRHLVPGVCAFGLLGFAVASSVTPVARWLLAGLLCLYVAVSVDAAFIACTRAAQWRPLWVLPLIFATYHAGYGCGFLRGLLDWGLRRRRPGAGVVRLTR